jgi:hypothetical protein
MPLGPSEDQWIVQHPGAIVQRLDGLHVLGLQGEVGRVQVLGDPLGLGRPRDDVVQLQVPPHQHLGGRAAVLGGDRRNGRFIDQPADPQRAVGLRDNVVLGVGQTQLSLVEAAHITDANGDPHTYQSASTVATAPAITDELATVIQITIAPSPQPAGAMT